MKTIEERLDTLEKAIRLVVSHLEIEHKNRELTGSVFNTDRPADFSKPQEQ